MGARTIHIRKEDRVVVLSGKDRGKTGRVLAVFPQLNTVLVERVNLIKRHTKQSGYGQQGGIIEKEAPVHASNVMVVCPRCNRQARTYRKRREDGTYVGRACRKCNEVVEN